METGAVNYEDSGIIVSNNNTTNQNSTSVRDIRFQMSLQKHVSFVECLRIQLDCPFGIRIQLKKRAVSQCRKVKKWFKKLRKNIHCKNDINSPIPNWYHNVFGNDAAEQPYVDDLQRNLFAAEDLSNESILTLGSANTVVHSPKRAPLFIPVSGMLNREV